MNIEDDPGLLVQNPVPVIVNKRGFDVDVATTGVEVDTSSVSKVDVAEEVARVSSVEVAIVFSEISVVVEVGVDEELDMEKEEEASVFSRERVDDVSSKAVERTSITADVVSVSVEATVEVSTRGSKIMVTCLNKKNGSGSASIAERGEDD
ncbi:MAG: hypothetical protein NUV53_04845 [Patescibacteria group bacterium]|nr:hypothetical protein [Patescibacteria group bacterium]